MTSDELHYQCCFCGERIAKKDPDPCELIFGTNFGNEDEERRQGLFCHAQCFQKRVHSSVDLGVLDN
jgi:hypothetical protein